MCQKASEDDDEKNELMTLQAPLLPPLVISLSGGM